MYKKFTVLVLHVEGFKIFVYYVSISFLLSWSYNSYKTNKKLVL